MANAQKTTQKDSQIIVSRLMDSLWISPESFINHNDHNWIRLNQHLDHVNALHLNQLIYSVFYGNSSFILNKSHADIGFIGTLNRSANHAKNRKYSKKVKAGFMDKIRYPENKTILVEGDSWFEYPWFLNDITDHLEKRKNFAIYSLAYGADWFSNMVSSLQYEYEYVKMKPDVFIISGGGNDLVGDSRLSAFIADNPIDTDNAFLKDYRNYVALRMQNIPVSMNNICFNNTYLPNKNNKSVFTNNQDIDAVLINEIITGRRYLNKNFLRWLVTIKLEYKMLFESLRKIDPDHFKSLKIITQGYDYAIPDFKRTFGLHLLVKNGEWMKEPLMRRGIVDPYIQRSIIATIIFEFNEMLIEVGKEYPNIYHIDSRGITEYYAKLHHNEKMGRVWFDELHPKSKVFNLIAEAYSVIINNRTDPETKVIKVKDLISTENQ